VTVDLRDFNQDVLARIQRIWAISTTSPIDPFICETIDLTLINPRSTSYSYYDSGHYL